MTIKKRKRFMKKPALSLLIVPILVLTFCTTTAFAKPSKNSAAVHNTPTYTLTTNFKNGQKRVDTVPFGRDYTIPMANGKGTIVINTNFTTAPNTKERSIIGQNPNAVGRCTNAEGTISYKDIVGITLASYKLTQHYCSDQRDYIIVPLEPPVEAWSTFFGIRMASHSASNGIDSPTRWTGYAIGNYVFDSGIPTPWGPIGSQCAGNMRLEIIGYGGYNVTNHACV